MHKKDGYQPLVLAAQAGDKLAFSELVKRFSAMAAAESRRQLQDSGLAEDAVQEAFLLAYLKLPALKDVNAFPDWFRKVLRTCCNNIRKQDMSAQLGVGEPWQDMPDLGSDALTGMLFQQDMGALKKILNSLHGPTKEACLQRFIYERPYKEIAAALNLPEGTVKRKVNHVRRRIAVELRGQDRPVIRVGYLPISDHLLAMLTHHFHDQRRYHIHLQKFLSWFSLVASLKNNQLDAAFIMAPLAMALHNQGLPIQYVLDAHYEGSAITIRKDHKLKQDKDWGRMGMPYPISTHTLMLANMMDAQAQPQAARVDHQYLGPSFLIKSLADRNIDAFFCAEPWNSKAVLEGAGSIYARSKDILPGHICCIVVVRDEFMARHGGLLRDYLKLLQTMNDYVHQHPGQSAAIQARYTGVPADLIRRIIKKQEITFGDLNPDRGRMESFMNLALKTGILKSACDLQNFVNTRVL
jgi:NitT/TauT family transport system substrate-binding protein